jgi:hypothetical protein
MKKIINGKKYDTETATKIESWDNDYAQNDFRLVTETLYLKKTGEYFLKAKGGPMSKYSTSCGSSTTGSTVIIPLSVDAAKKWAEQFMDADKFEICFGKVEE